VSGGVASPRLAPRLTSLMTLELEDTTVAAGDHTVKFYDDDTELARSWSRSGSLPPTPRAT